MKRIIKDFFANCQGLLDFDRLVGPTLTFFGPDHGPLYLKKYAVKSESILDAILDISNSEIIVNSLA
jgi:hypothetical protein